MAARGETDVAKRKQMYADMQSMIHEEAASAFRCSCPASTATASKLKGLSPIPLGGLMGYTFAEHVWLDA